MTEQTMFIGALTVLAGAIAFLFGIIMQMWKEMKLQWARCEEDKEKQSRRITFLESALLLCPADKCPQEARMRVALTRDPNTPKLGSMT